MLWKIEEKYFKRYKKEYCDNKSNIKIKVNVEKGSPSQLVKEAIKQKENNNYNKVYVVFDKDDYPDYNKAIEESEKSSIGCIYSNEAFEFWIYLLHLNEDTNRPIGRVELNDKIAKCFFGSEKYKKDDKCYEELMKKIFDSKGTKLEKAEEIADRGWQKHKKEYPNDPSQWCSSTNVFKLTRYLREWKD